MDIKILRVIMKKFKELLSRIESQTREASSRYNGLTYEIFSDGDIEHHCDLAAIKTSYITGDNGAYDSYSDPTFEASPDKVCTAIGIKISDNSNECFVEVGFFPNKEAISDLDRYKSFYSTMLVFCIDGSPAEVIINDDTVIAEELSKSSWLDVIIALSYNNTELAIASNLTEKSNDDLMEIQIEQEAGKVVLSLNDVDLIDSALEDYFEEVLEVAGLDDEVKYESLIAYTGDNVNLLDGVAVSKKVNYLREDLNI